MSNKFWTGITTTALATVIGTTGLSLGSSNQATASESVDRTAAIEQPSEDKDSQPTKSIELGRTQPQVGTENEENSITKIYLHQWKGVPAATLKVRNIPVLTFIGSNPETTGETKARAKVASSPNDPKTRAKAVASRLEQLNQEKIDPDKITVGWSEQTESYSIKVNEEELVKVDQTTLLPDATSDLGEDALQATNRLRRLMGGAPPLPEVVGKPQIKPAAPTGVKQSRGRGVASWYGPGFHGRTTANGERFNQNGLTAAHRSLPFGTRVRVTNVNNGRSVVVRINDRGPYAKGRVIDLSAGAARVIGLMNSGVAPVRIQVLGR